MGKLIIDGNSVFEIDEECMKRRKPSSSCDVEKYIQNGQQIYGQRELIKSLKDK